MNDKWDDRLCTGDKCLATEWARDMAAPKAKAPLTPRPPSTPPPPPTPPPTPPAPQSTPAATEAVEVPAHLSTLRALVQGAGLPTAPNQSRSRVQAQGSCARIGRRTQATLYK